MAGFLTRISDMNKPSLPSSRGFTVVEVLVTLLILSGGLLALAKFQGTMFGANALAKQRTEAAMLAQQKMEALRAYSTVKAACPASGDYCNIVTGNDAVAGASATFLRSWTVTNHTAAPVYKQILLTVTWQDSSGNSGLADTSGCTAQPCIALNSNIAPGDPVNTGSLIVNGAGSNTNNNTNNNNNNGNDGRGNNDGNNNNGNNNGNDGRGNNDGNNNNGNNNNNNNGNNNNGNDGRGNNGG